MTEQLKVLLVEDVALDAELALRQIKRAQIPVTARRVETEKDFRRVLQDFSPDVILSDFTMPRFDGLTALGIARALRPAVPFIFVSGTIGEEHAIQALKDGAADYVLKGNLLRLPAAVARAVSDARERGGRDLARRDHDADLANLQSIGAALPELLWCVALPARELLYASPSLAATYRQTVRGFFQNRVLWGDVIHSDDRPRVLAAWDKATRSASFDWEHRIVLPDGEIRWIHNRSRQVRGERSRLAGISHDITEIHERQEKLVRLNRVLVRTLRSVITGRRRVSASFVDFLARGLEEPAIQLSHNQLSDRELQILLLIGSGKSIKQIAADLSISINTVNTYRARILKKMRLRTSAALIRYVVEHGLVE